MWHACCQHAIPACPEMSRSENILRCPCMGVHVIESSHDLLSSGYTYDLVPPGRAMMEHDKRASTTLAVQPQNQPGRRCKTIPQTDLLALTPGIDSAQGIPRRKRPEWLHLPQQVTVGFPSIICQENGLQPPPMP